MDFHIILESSFPMNTDFGMFPNIFSTNSTSCGILM